MSKFVYLFGAGASANALPLVTQIPEELNQFSRQVRVFIERIRKTEDDNNKRFLPNLEILLSDIKWLNNECANHASIDTFAKKLTIQGNLNDLGKLKTITSLFFTYLQSLNKLDNRYDSFFASILGESYFDLPKDITIISWNYDNQFEIAYSKYSNITSVLEIEENLNVFHKGVRLDYENSKDKFSIFKINGSTGIYIKDTSDKVTLIKNFDEFGKENFFRDKILIPYLKFMEDPINHKRHSLSFAWEKNHFNKEMFESLFSRVSDATQLIIIGYSIPFFNRKIDKDIFKSMPNLKKIIIQDLNPNLIKQRIELLLETERKIDWVLNTDLYQFALPYEL